jgi:hypothetical protein
MQGTLADRSANQALERLSSLQLVTYRHVAGRGRPTTIWSAIDCVENGLTRKQIRDLFHGNISCSSIDQALEKLRSLGTATCRVTGAGQGRPATLWWAIGHEYREPMKEETPEGSLRRQLSALVRTF